MRRLLPVSVLALACGVAADAVLVLPFALSSQPSRLWFAAFGVGSLFAALAAGWSGTLGGDGARRSRLAVVVAISGFVAALVAGVGFLGLRSPMLQSSPILPLLSILHLGLGMTVVSLAAGWAALRFRSTRRSLLPDLITTAGLLTLAAFVLVQTIILAPLPS